MELYEKGHSSFTIDSTSSTSLPRSELYPKFDQLLEHISKHFGVQIDRQDFPATSQRPAATRCIVTRASPPKTAMAASMLSQETAPIVIKLTNDRQKSLFNELVEENLMQIWTNELKLSFEKKDEYETVIEIYGPQIQQGQLMRYIADYSDGFDDRYLILDLSAEAVGYFGRNKAADVKLEKINSKWTEEGCNVTFIRRTSHILLYAKP